MEILNKMKFLAGLLVFFSLVVFAPTLTTPVYAATSPSLGAADGFSILGGAAVTNTGSTTTTGAVGVSPGTSIDGGITAGGGIHSNDTDAQNAQAANLAAFTSLDQSCDFPAYQFGGGVVDLVGANLVPGVYCADAFELSGTLTLSGSGVWIFKSASTLVTSNEANVVGGDPCNVWWRIGSSATLGTNTSLIGNILALNGVNAMNTGAALNGRLLAQAAGTVTLDSNTISGSTCTAAAAASSTSNSTSSSTGGEAPCIASEITTVPTILELKRISPTSIFISWGPYAGIDTFNVRYGPTNGNWLYNTNVTGFSTTINALPPNQPMWFEVAARNDCSIGTYGGAKLVGQTESVNPNVLGASIGLPNTGFAPHQNNIPWYIPAGIGVTILTLLVLIQRKHRFSSKS